MKRMKAHIDKKHYKYVLLDDDDYLKFSRYRWRISKQKDYRRVKQRDYNKVYRNVTIAGVTRKLTLAREILSAPKGKQVDHINHNPLDNRKENLRICTNQQNSWNKSIKKNSYKGTYKITNKGGVRWQAQIFVSGKFKYLGRYDDRKDAARAYNEAAKIYFGDFALLNPV